MLACRPLDDSILNFLSFFSLFPLFYLIFLCTVLWCCVIWAMAGSLMPLCWLRLPFSEEIVRQFLITCILTLLQGLAMDKEKKKKKDSEFHGIYICLLCSSLYFCSFRFHQNFFAIRLGCHSVALYLLTIVGKTLVFAQGSRNFAFNDKRNDIYSHKVRKHYLISLKKMSKYDIYIKKN